MNLVLDASLDETDGEPLWSRQPGQTLIDDYLAWDRLGIGHRCETWLAWCPNRWTPVAVKLARPGQIEHPRARAAIEREARWLGRAAHPGFPRLLADGHTAQVPYVVTEYLEGPSVADAIDEHRFETADAMSLTLQLAAAVRRLHQLGIAHLDIKPDNVILHDSRPVLIDLGSVRPLGYELIPGPPLGSPGYAAPELESCETIDVRMDVYGLGMVLLEALAGVEPFDPVLAAADRPDPASVVASVAGLDRSVARVARRLLCPDPNGRPQSVELAMQELAGLVPSSELLPWPGWATPSLHPR